MKELFQVVLVEPEDNANIGSTARAMKNFGFSALTLAAPRRFDIERASITACNSRDILNRATVAPSLEEAIASCEDVIGFSGRLGKNRPSLLLEEWLDLIKQEKPTRKTGLVFGPEETGLHERHIKHCRWLVRIPTNPECSSLNLAQAVLIVLYELSKHSQEYCGERRIAAAPVPWSEFSNLDALVHAALEKSEFYNEGTPPRLPDLIGTLFRRILPDAREMKILQGIFGRIVKKLS